MKRVLRSLSLLIAKQYTSIGGQAVIEGVMMRSPNAFIVAVRKADGSIRLRSDQWFGLSSRFSWLKKPFLRGILMVIESMANGIVALNYSARIAMDEEEREKALKKGKSIEELEQKLKEKEKINWQTFLSIALSFVLGIGLFVFLPHAATVWISRAMGQEWPLDSFAFHAVDGSIKGSLFLAYIWGISFIPDIRRVFQYHGAEHKSISTFEAGQDLIPNNASTFSTLHPRCGTSFLFFLIFISIVLFSAIFTLIPISEGLPSLVRHTLAVLFKVVLMLPIAGLSYELIKLAGKHQESWWGKVISWPGMMLQKITTSEPDHKQLEVALASIKTALFLEDQFDLKKVEKRVVTLKEYDIQGLDEIANAQMGLKDFLEN